jgi:hypothetical protein
MSKRTLLLTFSLVILFGIGLNVAIGKWSVRAPARIKLQTVRDAQDPNMLFVGNSLLDGRLDTTALQQGMGDPRHSIRPLNAALGGSDPPVHRLITSYALRSHPSIRTLVVGVYDFQLTENDPHTPSELTGTRGLGQDSSFSSQEVAAAYGFDRLQEAEFVLLRPLKMVTYRENAWKYVELLRRSMDEMGMPHAATNRNGRVEDFAALEAGSSTVFDQKADDALHNGGMLNSSYSHIFDEAARHHLHVIVVVMPMSPSHWDRYYSRPSWNHYLEVEDKLLRAKGIQVIDASRWFPLQTAFVDSLHMTPESATEFSKRLGTQLVQAGM